MERVLGMVSRYSVLVGGVGALAYSALYTGEWGEGGRREMFSLMMLLLVSPSLTRLSPLFAVDGGERAVIFDRYKGVRQQVVGEGTHFLVPWLQKPIIYEVRTQAHEVTSQTGSRGESLKFTGRRMIVRGGGRRRGGGGGWGEISFFFLFFFFSSHFAADLQTVDVGLRLLFRPKVDSLPTIFSSYGLDYEQRILPSIGTEVLKSVMAQYDAGELITQREKVSQKVRESLVRRAADFGILLEDVAITHLGFSYEYTKAVEAKQVAQQDAERAKFEVLKVGMGRGFFAELCTSVFSHLSQCHPPPPPPPHRIKVEQEKHATIILNQGKAERKFPRRRRASAPSSRKKPPAGRPPPPDPAFR